MKTKITINKEQELYVFHEGKYITCLGFDVCINRLNKLAKELQVETRPVKRGTIKAYNEYRRVCKIAEEKNRQTGWRSQSELIPEFIGKEGQKVEVVTWCDGEIKRFYIGKSTGFIPCHLEIKKSNSSGGEAIYGYPFKQIRFLNQHRN